eukprot:312591_1
MNILLLSTFLCGMTTVISDDFIPISINALSNPINSLHSESRYKDRDVVPIALFFSPWRVISNHATSIDSIPLSVCCVSVPCFDVTVKSQKRNMTTHSRQNLAENTTDSLSLCISFEPIDQILGNVQFKGANTRYNNNRSTRACSVHHRTADILCEANTTTPATTASSPIQSPSTSATCIPIKKKLQYSISAALKRVLLCALISSTPNAHALSNAEFETELTFFSNGFKTYFSCDIVNDTSFIAFNNSTQDNEYIHLSKSILSIIVSFTRQLYTLYTCTLTYTSS